MTVLRPRGRSPAGALVFALALSGCATVRQTDPPVTATQQLLVSTAVDRAAAQLHLTLPPDSKVFLDASFLDADATVPLAKYTVAAVRSRLLRMGASLTVDRAAADVIVEARSGAQSVNDRRLLIGLPGLTLPVPLWGTLPIPEVPLFRHHSQTGRSKLALAAYDREGRLIGDTGTRHGEAQVTQWLLLLVISHSVQDIYPE